MKIKENTQIIFGATRQSLEDQNYFPIAVDLEQFGDIPPECRVFIATNTARGWSKTDVQAIQRYALQGGDILVFLAIPDPNNLENLSVFNEGLKELRSTGRGASD